MKVLRIYDHLGELKKEFNLYVEGEDFKWIASYPEPVWLGTVTLEEPGKEPEAEPIPEPEATEPGPIETTDLAVLGVVEVPVVAQVAKLFEEKEVKDEPKKNDRKRSRVKRSTPSASLKSTEGLHQEDSPGNTNQGN